MSCSAFPSSVRSLACQLVVSASIRVRILVAVTFLPSRCTPVDLTTHLLPSWAQVPSPNPPLLSKVHDRIFLPTGSHPIHCVPPPIRMFLKVAPNVATTKFWLS